MIVEAKMTPTPETRAWQDAHEPYLTVRVWRDCDIEIDPKAVFSGKVEPTDEPRTLVNVKWAREVDVLPAFEKPHDAMLKAITAVSESLLPVALTLMTVRVMVETPPQEGEEP